MALEFKIGKSAFDALSADVKKEYKQTGDDYTLDLTGYEDPAELRRARDHEKAEAAAAKRDLAAAKTAQTAAEKKADDLAKANGDTASAVAAKDTEWKTKYDADIADRDGKLTGLQKSVLDGRRNDLANAMAKDISTVPGLLAPKIAERITCEFAADNTVKVTILGKDGKGSAMSLDDLRKETLTNKEFAGVIIGSKATGGGGAPNVPGSGGGAPRANNIPQDAAGKPVDLSKMDPRAFADSIKSSKENGAT